MISGPIRHTNVSQFDPGTVVATPGAISVLAACKQSASDFLYRHVTGDWGELDDEDRSLNDAAVKNGDRILSSYSTVSGETLWIITEAADDDGARSHTTLLLPSEY